MTIEEVIRAAVREELRKELVRPPPGVEWTEYQWLVYNAVFMIPHGRVASYGEISMRIVGNDGGSRTVGGALKKLGYDCRFVPWWRVVYKDGWLPDDKAALRRSLLEGEGVQVRERGWIAKEYWLQAPAGNDGSRAAV